MKKSKFLAVSSWMRSALIVPLCAFADLAMSDNIAVLASAEATSTYCNSSPNTRNCYSAGKVNDGNISTALGGQASWANANVGGPHYWTAVWPSYVFIEHAIVYTSAGYPIQDFDLEYYDAYTSQWEVLSSVRGNTSLEIDVAFSPVYADRIRVKTLKGPARQTIYHRLNEVVIEGDASYL